jgi:putative transposase
VKHIHENARKKDIFIDFIGGYSDHCHCLVSLGIEQTIKEIVQMIKGESSFWINKQQLCTSKFSWQDDYFAASVSETMIEKTRDYIKEQEDHHKITSFKDEYNDFLMKHGFKRFED